MRKKFPLYRQLDQMDCGPTCVRMVASYYGKEYSLSYLRERTYITKEGVSAKGIMEGAKHIGLDSMAVKIPFTAEDGKASLQDAPTPCILHWNQNHFVVAYKISKTHVWIADPADTRIKLEKNIFLKSWLSDGDKGIAILLETTPAFYETDQTGSETTSRRGFGFLLNYLRPYKGLIVQIFIGMLIGIGLQFIMPFLTQSIVDIGINNRDIDFIYIILAAQLILFLSQTSVKYIQSWIFLHISSRINISLVNDFLSKLLRLPVSYFDTKLMGDLLQRLEDHNKIEDFMTYSSISTLFSVISLFVFGGILAVFNPTIFWVFLIASALYAAWVFFFLKKQKELNYTQFSQLSQNQQTIVELMEAIPEIKLQGSEDKRRFRWNLLQYKLFKVKVRTMAVGQYQETGALFIAQIKDIFISFIAAKAVTDGQMSLGTMMSIQYIVGQASAPFQQIIGFVKTLQDAKISLERLAEIHEAKDEEPAHLQKEQQVWASMQKNGDIVVKGLSFRYTDIDKYVLKDINLYLPEGSVTAIVGTSGSGKTTLVKLLLGLYPPSEGKIMVGGVPLTNLSPKEWRKQCGTVMQDGFVFGDTIANNISESDDIPDNARLIWASRMANLDDFIYALPTGFNTQIGSKGSGISGGQRQRILIARAVYRNPKYIFLDEATSALDANNERVISENLEQFYQGRTVVIVAHRLSTVANADQIIVLHQGEIVEIGTHRNLVDKRGYYYKLVKNQLELGN